MKATPAAIYAALNVDNDEAAIQRIVQLMASHQTLIDIVVMLPIGRVSDHTTLVAHFREMIDVYAVANDAVPLMETMADFFEGKCSREKVELAFYNFKKKHPK